MNTTSPIVVCGLPRCGSSLTMQMLAAAGIACAGHYPGFEVSPDDQDKPDIEVGTGPLRIPEAQETYNPDFVNRWSRGAFKLLEPHRITIPAGFKYRFIFLTRSRRQQCYSQVKMMRLMGAIKGQISEDKLDEIKADLAREEKAAFAEISKHEGSILKVRFEDLISHPEMTADRIAWFLGLAGALVPVMAKCVKPRSVTVYPGMLETELMQQVERCPTCGDLVPSIFAHVDGCPQDEATSNTI